MNEWTGGRGTKTESVPIPIPASEHAFHDPAGAIAWAARQNEEPLQLTAMRAAVRGWFHTDALAASEWLAAQPAGPMRDAAVHGLIDSVRHAAPEEALHWASTLADARERESAQLTVLKDLVWHNPSKAQGLSIDPALPESVRAGLRQHLEQQAKSGRH